MSDVPDPDNQLHPRSGFFSKDRDGDLASDFIEVLHGLDPDDPDVDDDGVPDGVELRMGLDPKTPLFDQMGVKPAPTALPEDKPSRPVELTDVRADASIDDFLINVLAQRGDRYQLGVDNSLRDADPDSWDGSELVEWAANRAGVMINDGAANQYKQLARHGGEVSVDVALATPGALLYEFTGNPLGGARPTRASTAISLGDGKHIIDIDPVHGVRIMEAKDFTFTHAGVMPGFVDAQNPNPMARAIVEQALADEDREPGPVRLDTTPTQEPEPPGPDAAPAPPAPDPVPTPNPAPEPAPPDPAPGPGPAPTADPTTTPPGPLPDPVPVAPVPGPAPTPPTPDPMPDPAPLPGPAPTPAPTPPPAPDTPEITALAGRATELRERYNELLSSKERVDLVDQRNDVGKQSVMAAESVEHAQTQTKHQLAQIKALRDDAVGLDARAAAAQAAGSGREAEELREEAAAARHTAQALETLAEQSRADAIALQPEADRLAALLEFADERLERWDATRLEGESVIDAVEDRVRHLRESEGHLQRAAGHEAEAAWFQESGDPEEAANRQAMAAQARQDAVASREAATAIPVDEAALRKAGILTGIETVETVQPGAAGTPEGSGPPTTGDGTPAASAEPGFLEQEAAALDPTAAPRDPEGEGPVPGGDTSPSTVTTTPAPGPAEETRPPDDPSAPPRLVVDEAAALEARAAGLREEYLQRKAYDRADELSHIEDVIRSAEEAAAGVESARISVGIRTSRMDEFNQEAVAFEQQAADAERAGKAPEARELREQAAERRADAVRSQTVADRAKVDLERLTPIAQERSAEAKALTESYKQEGAALVAAEEAIDGIEDKARHLREADGHRQDAARLGREADELLAQGKVDAAAARRADAAQARSASIQSTTAAATVVIDNAALSEAGLLGGPTVRDDASAGAGQPQASFLDAEASQLGAPLAATDAAGADSDITGQQLVEDGLADPEQEPGTTTEGEDGELVAERPDASFPDVGLEPAGPGPLPMPYPNDPMEATDPWPAESDQSGGLPAAEGAGEPPPEDPGFDA